MGEGYAKLVFETYQLTRSQQFAGTHWQRFFTNNRINLIQCAEQLENPVKIVEKTYNNCTWQNETLGAALSVAGGNRTDISNLGFRLALMGYPSEISNEGDTISKTALQYIENHDHSRFICNFATVSRGDELLTEGNRDLWYKVQPYLIGLMTGKGVPLLWQGQELCENYYVPNQGLGRVLMFRPVRWDYFYDAVGKRMIALVRKLVKLRRQNAQFRSTEHYFHNDYDQYQAKGLLIYSRSSGGAFSLVALNFSDQDQTVPVVLPVGGNFKEELHGIDNLSNVSAGISHWVSVPSNYGRVWTREGN